MDASVDWQRLPDRAQVVVVEQDGEIVAHWLYLPTAHAEAAWKREGTGAGVTRALLRGMRKVIHEDGAEGVWVSSIDADMGALLVHLGAQEVPGTHYLMGVSCLR